MTSLRDRADASVVRCAPDDLVDLAAFQARMFPGVDGHRGPEGVRWLHAKNPQRRGDALGVWISRRDGDVVGQQAEIAVDLRVGADTCPASWAVDLMVDPRWRLRGVAPALGRAQREGARVVCGMNIGDMASRSYLREGWTDLGRVPAYVLPIDVPAVVEAFGVRASGARAAVRLGAHAARSSARLLRGRTRLVPIESFDERADLVWSDVAAEYGVIARRDGETLRWRFDEAPWRGEYLRFYGRREGDARVTGYVVLRRSVWNGVPVMNVVDYLATPRHVGSLLLAAGRVAQQHEVAATRCITLNARVDRALQLRGFLRRRLAQAGIRFMIWHRVDEPLAEVLSAPSSWFVTAADSDLDLASQEPT